MTRLLFIPDDQTFILLDDPRPADELAAAIPLGGWTPPLPYPTGLALHVIRLGNLILATVPPLMEHDAPAPAGVSPRQRQVLAGLAEGLSTKEIALRLGVQPRTVLMHVRALKERFNASTRAQTVSRARHI